MIIKPPSLELVNFVHFYAASLDFSKTAPFIRETGDAKCANSVPAVVAYYFSPPK